MTAAEQSAHAATQRGAGGGDDGDDDDGDVDCDNRTGMNAFV